MNKENKINTPISMSELLNMKFPENVWLVDKLIPSNSVIAVSGDPSCYKTWLLLDLAISVSKGKALYNTFTTQQNNILIIDEENGTQLLQSRLKLLLGDKNLDLPIYFLSLTDFNICDDKHCQKILNFCQNNDVGLILIDSLIRIHNSDENDANKMSKVLKKLKILLKIIFQ